MVVLVTCKYIEDPLKTEGGRVLTRLYDVFSDAQGQITPKSAVVLITCKNEEDPIKNEGARVLTSFPHYKFMGIFQTLKGS